MGIKNLNKLLRNKSPNSIKTIHCVFIFDGKSPTEKSEEQIRRKKEKEKLVKSVYDLEKALEVYYQTGTIEKILQDLYKRRRVPRLLKKSLKIDMDWIEEKIEQKKKQIINVTQKDFTIVKNLFNILNVPYYTAPWEAEKMCAKLCIDGLVDCVLSEDTDVLAYNSPIFLSKIDTRSETCTCIKFSDIIEELGVNEEQFLDICIMCGTDYNKNIPKIGSMNSFKLIQLHKNIENIEKNTKHDVSILKYKRVREMFKIFEDYKIDTIPYCGQPDFEQLVEFTKKYQLDINIENLRKDFIKELIFLET